MYPEKLLFAPFLIDIQAEEIRLKNQSLIQTTIFLSGQAGDIDIQAQNLSLHAGSNIGEVSTGVGKSGNIHLNIREQLTLHGRALEAESEQLFRDLDRMSDGVFRVYAEYGSRCENQIF